MVITIVMKSLWLVLPSHDITIAPNAFSGTRDLRPLLGIRCMRSLWRSRSFWILRFGLGLVGPMSFHGLGFSSALLVYCCVVVHGEDVIPTDGSKPIALAE